MRGSVTGQLLLALLRTQVRDTQLVFWNAAFFALLLIIALGPLSGGDAAVRLALTVSVMTLSSAANGLFTMGIGLAGARERGVFRRYAVTPLSIVQALGAWYVSRVLVVSAGGLVLLVVARVVYQVGWAASVPTVTALLGAGATAFVAIGFAIGSWCRSPLTTNRALNVVLLPMIATGGVALPPSMLPDAWLTVSAVFPTSALASALTGAFAAGGGLVEVRAELLGLVAWACVGLLVGALGWRIRHQDV